MASTAASKSHSSKKCLDDWRPPVHFTRSILAIGQRFSATLICLLVLSLSICQCDQPETNKPTYSDGPAAGDEFVHLTSETSATRRVHLVAEISRHQQASVRLEEHLDLRTWSQLIKFSWTEGTADNSQPASQPVSRQLNALVLNAGKRVVLVQYAPFTCNLSEHITHEGCQSGEQSWLKYLDTNSGKTSGSDVSEQAKLVESILSTSTDSPYLSRIVSAEGSGESWIFGLSGIWLLAEHRQTGWLKQGQMDGSEQVWTLHLPESSLSVVYSFAGKNQEPSERNLLKSVLLSRATDQPAGVVDSLKLLHLEYHFSDREARDLLRLPAGYDCPANPLELPAESLKFERLHDAEGSGWFQLELVSNYPDKSEPTFGNVNNVAIARAPHPLNPASWLSAISLNEKRMRLLHDYHSRLLYRVHRDNFANWGSPKCDIERLTTYDFQQRHSMDPFEVEFASGINLTLNDRLLDFLLDADTKSQPPTKLKSLNRQFLAHLGGEEFTFESEVPATLENMLDSHADKHSASAGGSSTVAKAKNKMSVTRFYRRSPSQSGDAPLVLSSIRIYLHDPERFKRLADIRITLHDYIRPVSLTRLADLFDLRDCVNLEKDSVQLSIVYPIPVRLIDDTLSRSQEFVEQFYQWPTKIWKTQTNATGGSDSADETAELAREKSRLARGFNFLRMPKVELRRQAAPDAGSSSSLALQITLLENISPLHLFERLEGMTFVGASAGEHLLVSSLESCAKFCQQVKCQMFAYDSRSHECELSPISLEADRDEEEDDDDDDAIVTKQRSTSQIYFAPAALQTAQTGVRGEPDLSELLTFIEHHAGDFEEFHAADTNSDSTSLPDNGEQQRARRSSRVTDLPLMSFEFADKNPNANPKSLLVPKQVLLERIPLTLDVSKENHAARVAAAFSVRHAGQKYSLTALDDWAQVSTGVNERHFRLTLEGPKSYLSLKRLHSVSLDTCELLCYNIHDDNQGGAGEQICFAFSYCSFQRQCVMAVRTEGDLGESLPVDEADEGIVKDLAQGDEQLLSDDSDCLVSRRNSLSGYEGPIKVSSPISVHETLVAQNPSMKLEWFLALLTTAREINLRTQDECALACERRNRHERHCLAFDFCKVLKDAKTGVFESSCYLLLAPLGNQIGSLRRQLSSPAGKSSLAKAKAPAPQCARYVLSHMADFGHIQFRDLSAQSDKQLLWQPFELDRVNLDECATECFARSANCQTFIYCGWLESITRSITRTCYLYGNSDTSTKAKWKTPELVRDLDKHNRDCHVYLKNLTDSPVSLPSTTQPIPDVQILGEGLFWPIVSFVSVYTALLACLVIYLKSQRICVGVQVESAEPTDTSYQMSSIGPQTRFVSEPTQQIASSST